MQSSPGGRAQAVGGLVEAAVDGEAVARLLLQAAWMDVLKVRRGRGTRWMDGWMDGWM